ncbi:hypothetical protein MMC06_005722, partial [Schaereria dolodes]|nr:hypothetical protein [Schaereria dolodes]
MLTLIWFILLCHSVLATAFSILDRNKQQLFLSRINGSSTVERLAVRDRDGPMKDSNDVIPLSVGDAVQIVYTVRVIVDGRVVCENPLEPTLLQVEPQSFLEETNYVQNSGSVTPKVYSPANPFQFIPWAAGQTNVIMQGIGCGYSWTFDDVVYVNGPTISLDASTNCPNGPEYQVNGGYLAWAAPGKEYGCQIVFRILNSLRRPADFGVMNLLTTTQNYLIIDGLTRNFVDVVDTTLLDEPQGSIAYPATDGDVGTLDTAVLRFTDAPSTTVGSLCFTTPSDRIARNWNSIGFELHFQTFILQDWDKGAGTDRAQIPIGSPVVEWAIRAQADCNPTATPRCTVNAQQSRLIQAPE